MKTDKRGAKAGKVTRFLVLVPHRDALKGLLDFRRALFGVGFVGAYSFPAVAPLALLARPFSQSELKETARMIRSASLASDGRIGAGELTAVGVPDGLLDAGPFGALSFFGPVLDAVLPVPAAALAAERARWFTKAVLCAALVPTAPDGESAGRGALPAFAPVWFRAARVANLAIRPLVTGSPAGPETSAAAALSFEWRLDAGCWLPAFRGGR